MTILFVLENYYPNIGGVETMFKSLVEELSDRGHQVIIVTTLLKKGDLRREQQDNITILRYPFWNRYFFTFFAIFPIFKIIREVDLVHTTSYNAGLPAFFAAKLFQKKVIITFHEMWGDLWFRLPYMSTIGKRLHYWFEQMLVRLPFDKFIAVSESTATNLRQAGVDPKRVVANYNGINYTEFKKRTAFPKKENQKFIYTYFGRLGVSKGLDLLLEAAKELQKSLPNSALQLIVPKSPAPFYQDIMQLIEENGLRQYIVLQHNLPFDVLKKEIQKSDCIVIPSYSEGFCFAAVETIALGVPIISSDQQSLREVVCGRHIKMKALTVSALVEAVEQAAKGAWEETPVRKFHLKDTVQRYVEMYKAIA